MPLIRFTANIQRHAPCPARTVTGSTVRDALNAYFAEHPRARGYVLDEHDALRTHMVVFLDGSPIRDRSTLSDRVRDDATIDVMQALSGG